MNKNLIKLGIIMLVVGGWLFSTGLSAMDKTETTIITDMAGREVKVPKEVDEVVGIGAGALRLITYLNATDKVVGVEEFEKRDQTGRPYIIAHPELAQLPSIGPIHGGDTELITYQNPDVIFWTYTTAGEADDLQRKTGIPVIVVRYGDLSSHRHTFYEALRLMGKVLDKEKRANQLTQYVESKIQELKERTENIPSEEKPTVYIGGVGYRGSHGVISTEPAYEPFLFVKARNVASELGVEHAMISKEKLVEWNPDIIFVDEGGYKLAIENLQQPKYQTIKAVKEENIYGVLPYNYYTRNYGTILANSYYIGKVLYPEKFADLNPQESADEIFRELIGKAVYKVMADQLGGFKKIELIEQ